MWYQKSGMKNLTEINFEKSRSGVYKDNEENRRLHRVGQRYGDPKKEEISPESRKSDLEELKQDMLQAEKELKAHNKRRSLYASYTKGEENWSRTKAKLEQKLDTLQQEYKRRFAEVNRKPEEKKPNKVKIERKLDGLQKEYDKREQSAKNEVVEQGKESFNRVNLADIPNAHKVNLKKYLSAKRKAAVDEAWSKANFDNSSARMLQDSYNKMRDAFNDNFDSMSKAERAEQLYRILKVKNAMEKKS